MIADMIAYDDVFDITTKTEIIDTETETVMVLPSPTPTENMIDQLTKQCNEYKSKCDSLNQNNRELLKRLNEVQAKYIALLEKTNT